MASDEGVSSEVNDPLPPPRDELARLRRKLERANKKVAILEADIEEKTKKLYVEHQRVLNGKEHLETMLAVMQSAVVEIDEDGEIIRSNDAFTKMLGFSADEVKGMAIAKLIPQLQLGNYCSDGVVFNGTNKEIRVTSKSGEMRPLLASGSPMFCDKESCIGAVILFHDLSEFKNLEAQLVQAQKLESVGRLAAGVAHEINTPIQYVGDNTRFLLDAFSDFSVLLETILSEIENGKNSLPATFLDTVRASIEEADTDFLLKEIPQAIDQSIQGVDRVAKIVRAMKQFSHQGAEEQQGVDFNALVENTLTISTNEWKYVAELTTDFAKDLPLISCYPDELSQVILNLVVNAAHAISGTIDVEGGAKGEIVVRTSVRDNQVVLEVSDTGGGIPNAIQDKIFEPFFTTKEIGSGTGQGLALSRSIVVDQHLGELNFRTTEGEGTVFSILLPLS